MHHVHLSLGDVLANHWGDVELFAYALVLLGLARLCLGRWGS